jgi:hypothetical protein
MMANSERCYLSYFNVKESDEGNGKRNGDMTYKSKGSEDYYGRREGRRPWCGSL